MMYVKEYELHSQHFMGASLSQCPSYEYKLPTNNSLSWKNKKWAKEQGCTGLIKKIIHKIKMNFSPLWVLLPLMPVSWCIAGASVMWLWNDIKLFVG